MAERTLPSAGMSPIDAYLAPTYVKGEIGKPAGYFELLLAGHRAAYCNALYAKVDTGSGDPSVSGLVTVIEGKLSIPDTETMLSTMCVLSLDFENKNTYCGTPSIQASYILLRDQTVASGSTMNSLFNFIDAVAVENSTTDLIATSGEVTQTHAIRCLLGGVNLWIKAHTGNPSG